MCQQRTEGDKFSEMYTLPRQNQEETENIKRWDYQQLN